MQIAPVDLSHRDVRYARYLFAALTLGFGLAAINYAVAPGMVVAQFAQWDRWLGGDAAYPEIQNRIWIALAAANVATLSFMSWLLWSDMRKNQAVHLPLLFMKCVSAGLFIVLWFATPGSRSLLVAAAADVVTAAAIWYFPTRAFRTFAPRE